MPSLAGDRRWRWVSAPATAIAFLSMLSRVDWTEHHHRQVLMQPWLSISGVRVDAEEEPTPLISIIVILPGGPPSTYYMCFTESHPARFLLCKTIDGETANRRRKEA